MAKTNNPFVTPTILKSLALGFNFDQALSSNPFYWNKSNHRVEIISGWKLWWWRLNVVVAFLHIGFILIRCAQVSVDGNANSFNKFYMQFIAELFLLAGVLQFGTITQYNEIAMFTNLLLNYCEQFWNEYGRGDWKIKPAPIKRLEVSMTIMLFDLVTCVPLMTAIAIVEPDSPDQFASVFGGSSSSPFIKALGIAVQAYIMILNESTAAALVVSGLTLHLASFGIMTELDHSQNAVTLDRLRTTHYSIQEYQKVQVLITIYNQIYGSVTLPVTQFLVILWVVFCAYGSINGTGIFALFLGFLGVFSTILLFALFSLLALAQACSSEIRQKWVRRRGYRFRHMKWVHKKALSLRNVQCNIRTWYYVDFGIVLTMMSIITEQTVDFLILNSD